MLLIYDIWTEIGRALPLRSTLNLQILDGTLGSAAMR